LARWFRQAPSAGNHQMLRVPSWLLTPGRGIFQHHTFLRGSSFTPPQGDDRQLRFLPQPLSLL